MRAGRVRFPHDGDLVGAAALEIEDAGVLVKLGKLVRHADLAMLPGRPVICVGEHLPAILLTQLAKVIRKPVAADAGRFAGLLITMASSSSFQSSFVLLPSNCTEVTAFSASLELRLREVIRTSPAGVPRQKA